MELRQLRYFVAVADTLNFSRAAESLYVSQSALSKQISELEQELGVTLFERDRRNVALTQAGRVLQTEAKGILIQSEKLVPLLRHEAGQNQPERSIHIAVEPGRTTTRPSTGCWRTRCAAAGRTSPACGRCSGGKSIWR